VFEYLWHTDHIIVIGKRVSEGRILTGSTDLPFVACLVYANIYCMPERSLKKVFAFPCPLTGVGGQRCGAHRAKSKARR
jgi:hypothetical protein